MIDWDVCINCLICVDYCYVNALTDVEGQLSFDVDLCIGCGLCASHCPENAINMVVRENFGKIYPTASTLDSQIQKEAIIGKLTSFMKK